MSVHKTKTGHAVRWREGKRHRSRLFRTKNAARIFDNEVFDKGRLGSAADALVSEIPFDEVCEQFWASYNKTVSDATRTRNRRYLTEVMDFFGGVRLCDVTTRELDRYRLHLESTGRGAPTIRHILFLLSKLFRHAVRMGYLPPHGNPVAFIDKPSAPRTRLIQPFPPERVEAVRGWFLERGKLEDATLISVLAYAGPRPAEAYAYLTWADVADTTIIFRGEKTGKDRSTRLLEPLRDDLRAFRGLSEGGANTENVRAASDVPGSPLAEPTNVVSLGRGPIFGWSTTRFNSWRDDGAWRKMVDDLDLLIAGKRARPYDLRHAFATLLLGEGTRLPELADQMGNSLAVCQRWYAHLDNIGEQQGASERVWAAREQTTVKEAM